MLMINVYHGGQILNTISIHDLKRQIHVGLELLLSHFNLIISARINTV
jgi:hypothetical protein